MSRPDTQVSQFIVLQTPPIRVALYMRPLQCNRNIVCLRHYLEVNPREEPTAHTDTWAPQGTTQQASAESATLANDHDHGSHASHDCCKEASAVSAKVSLPNSRGPQYKNLSTMQDCAHEIPLDRILLVCRDAVGRLRRLFDCPCTRNPCFGLLYASIFARILTSYRQSAG